MPITTMPWTDAERAVVRREYPQLRAGGVGRKAAIGQLARLLGRTFGSVQGQIYLAQLVVRPPKPVFTPKERTMRLFTDSPPGPRVYRASGLTPRQEEVYRFMVAFRLEQGRMPTTRDVMAGLGIKSPNGVCCHWSALQRKGLITGHREAAGARAIQFVGVQFTVSFDDSEVGQIAQRLWEEV